MDAENHIDFDIIANVQAAKIARKKADKIDLLKNLKGVVRKYSKQRMSF